MRGSLIGSGSLLITCRAADCERLRGLLEKAGIQVSLIGEVLQAGEGVELLSDSSGDSAWPRFSTDEITRALKILRNS